ncbi:hypothetical protein E2542_SST06466 [Spatholobus suberectus]|nr:hypothetical protein E2542_SST06466 [Spatholobus suberectus]
MLRLRRPRIRLSTLQRADYDIHKCQPCNSMLIGPVKFDTEVGKSFEAIIDIGPNAICHQLLKGTSFNRHLPSIIEGCKGRGGGWQEAEAMELDHSLYRTSK